MIKWLGENGEKLVGIRLHIRFFCRLHRVEAQECYVYCRYNNQKKVFS
jgi:hypothetical protein